MKKKKDYVEMIFVSQLIKRKAIKCNSNQLSLCTQGCRAKLNLPRASARFKNFRQKNELMFKKGERVENFLYHLLPLLHASVLCKFS